MDRDLLRGLLERAGIQNIRPTGEGFEAICFRHGSSSGKPNWKISADNGLWLCWKPSCGVSGNLASLLVQCLHMPIREALKYIDSIPRVASIGDEWALPNYDRRYVEDNPTRPERLLGLYHHCPVYMRRRGFPKRFLKEFDIGYDMETERVTFPVRALDGRLLGFTRRRTDGDPNYKYLHDIEGGKVRSMYLAERIDPKLPLGISEGPVDALMARLRARQTWRRDDVQKALSNMVAVLHDGITVHQCITVSRIAPPMVVLGFDLWKTNEEGERKPDEAGVAATLKSIKNLRRIGIENISVLSWKSFDDLGELPLSAVDEIDLIPATDWILQS